jgi:hypothetical protein
MSRCLCRPRGLDDVTDASLLDDHLATNPKHI